MPDQQSDNDHRPRQFRTNIDHRNNGTAYLYRNITNMMLNDMSAFVRCHSNGGNR